MCSLAIGSGNVVENFKTLININTHFFFNPNIHTQTTFVFCNFKKFGFTRLLTRVVFLKYVLDIKHCSIASF